MGRASILTRAMCGLLSSTPVLSCHLIDVKWGHQHSSTGPTAKVGALFGDEEELIPMVSTFISLSETVAVD